MKGRISFVLLWPGNGSFQSVGDWSPIQALKRAGRSHKEDPAFGVLGIIYSITRSVDLGVRQRITGTESKLTLSGAAAFTF